MNKPWYKSLTLISCLVFIGCVLAEYYLGKFGPPEIHDQIIQITVPVKAAAVFTTVLGLRRTVGVKDEGVKAPTLKESDG